MELRLRCADRCPAVRRPGRGACACRIVLGAAETAEQIGETAAAAPLLAEAFAEKLVEIDLFETRRRLARPRLPAMWPRAGMRAGAAADSNALP